MRVWPKHRRSPATALVPDAPTPDNPPVSAGLRAALMLLTRLPVGSAPLSTASRRWGAAFFPVVGLLVGAIGAAIFVVARPGLGDFLAACLTVLGGCLLTGALHEDGLADTADALGGGRDVGQVLAILKDSRHGTYGVMALAASLLLRVGALDRLGAGAALGWVVAAVLARSAVVGLMTFLPYVTAPEVARSGDAARARAPQLVVAIVLAATIAGGLALPGAGVGDGGELPFGLRAPTPMAILVCALAVTITTAGAGWLFRRRTGGVTGDFLGAAEQAGEVAVLLALVILMR